MSLIAWWPLNDNTNNYGTLGAEIQATASGATFTDGKIGKALYKGSLTLTGEQWKKIIGNTISIAMWVYTRNDGSYSAGTPFFGMGGMTAPNNRKFTMFHYNTKTNLHCSWQNDDSNSTYWSCRYTNFFELNKWVHLCIVQDAATNTVTVYRNGEQYSKSTVSGLSSMNFKEAGTAPIRANIDYQHMNDLRIYDHALSQAEVKELSKALVVHYTFDDILVEPTTNLVTQGALSWSKLTVNVSSSHSNGVYTITTTTANNDAASGQIRANFPLAILTTGATYYFSCKYKLISGTGTFTLSNWCDSSLSDKKTKDCGDFYELSAKCYTTRTYNSTYRFLDCNLSANSVIEVWDVQLQTNDKVTPYVLGTRKSMLHNEAGLTQPTYSTNTNLVQDSASGTFSLSCTGNTMINTPVTGDITAGATISCWIKVPTYPSVNAIVFADYNSKLSFGFYGTQNAIISCGGYSAPYISNIKGSWINGWNHVVVTRNSGGTISCYLNGVKLSTTGSNNWSSTSGYSTIGGRYNGSYTTYFTGYVDDYRVYHTLLSDTDIQDLYKTKAYVTDKGDMITHSYIENCHDLQITNSCNAKTRDIQEIGNEEYEQLEYIASTGIQYIDTGVYWTSEKATIVADLEVTTFKGSTTIFGSEERYSGSSRYFAHILHAGSANGNYANYIGTTSRGTATSLTKDTRYVLEYIAHGDNTFSTKTTNHNTGEVKVYNNKVSYTGTILTRQNSTQTATNRGHIYIFSNHNAYNGTGGIQKMGAMKLYRFTMTQDDIYIRDFIPCRRKSDSKVGLFDMVAGQFYTSPVGNFTAGSVVTNEDTTVKFLSGGSIQARQFIEI